MKKTKLGFMGDVMIGRLVNQQLENVSPAYIWGDMLAELKDSDLNLINLETTLTMSEEIVPKVFNFKASPKKVQSLVEGSIHVANLANNHILDFNEEGLVETIQTLDEANILHVGAGMNLEEASKPVMIERKGLKIGILGCTDNEPSWKATTEGPGTRYVTVNNFEAIKNDIINLRPQVDLLILTIHWGPNMKERPSKSFIDFAHQSIEAGVDIFHGHSAHIFQGVEIYKKKIILYDTGDFIDDYYVDPILRNDHSFYFVVEIDQRSSRTLRLIPTLISNFQVNKAKEEDLSESIKQMRKLSGELGTEFDIVNNELVLPL